MKKRGKSIESRRWDPTVIGWVESVRQRRLRGRVSEVDQAGTCGGCRGKTQPSGVVTHGAMVMWGLLRQDEEPSAQDVHALD